MEAKNAMMATQNVVPFPTEYHNASFLEPRDVPDIRYIRDKLRRIDPAANISYRKNPESDIGNAHLLARLINGKAVYVEGQGWYVFCGGKWCFDKEQLRTMILCQEISKQLVAYINELPMDEGKKKYLAAAKKWDKLSYRKKLLEDAASKRFVDQGVFDQQPHKFNCLNGTLDLRTGEFSEHAPKDMLTQMSNVTFDPEAKCERWERYVAEIMQDDTEMIGFLQMSFGYALSGENPYECMFLLLGLKTRNGKGVLTSTFEHMLGDYSTTSNPEAIFGKGANNGNEHSEGVARLFRKRFIAVHELEKDYTLNTRKIKSFTGNDTITARVLYSSSFEFKPQGKVPKREIPSKGAAKACTEGAYMGRIGQLPDGRYCCCGYSLPCSAAAGGECGRACIGSGADACFRTATVPRKRCSRCCGCRDPLHLHIGDCTGRKRRVCIFTALCAWL